MPAFVTVDSDTTRKEFVAYNLVFGPASNGLPVVTARHLSDVMSDKGYDMPVREAEMFLREQYANGQLRIRTDENGKQAYVIA